jgi:hypothetical protein
VVGARAGGHLLLGIRYDGLTASRRHNVAGALAQRGWQLDEDDDGVTLRFPPGTDASTAAMEILSVLTLAGAPSDVRRVTAVDANGATVALA